MTNSNFIIRNGLNVGADVTIGGNLTVSGQTVTTNHEVINTSEIVAGNVSAARFIGDGSLLTGLPAGYTNSDVAAYMPSYLPTYTGNVSAATVTATRFVGDGSGITNVLAATDYTNANVAAYLPTYSGNMSGTLTTASQPNITSVGTLGALTVTGTVTAGTLSGSHTGSGAGLTGVPGATNYTNANVDAHLPSYAGNVGGTITTASQPNITSVGTLGALTVTGTVTAGTLSGSHTGSGAGLTGVPGATNYTNANVAAYLPTYAGNVSAAHFIGDGSQLTNVPGSTNFTSANVAAYLPTYAGNLGGTLTTASQPNITAVGTLGALTVTGTITGNVSGSAATVTAASQPNITAVGTLSALTVTGTITGNVSGSAATVTAASQPAITSVGTLTSLTVSGAVSSTSATNSTSSTNGAVTIAGGLGVSKDMWIGGTLYVANIVSQTTSILTVTDPLIYLDSSKTFPYNYEIGLYGNYQDVNKANVEVHSGIVRSHNDGKWYFFSNTAEPSGGVVTFDSNTTYDTLVTGPNQVNGNPATVLINGGTAGTGNVGAVGAGFNNAYFNNYYGTLQTASQPNITAVGTLGSLAVTGNVTAGGFSGAHYGSGAGLTSIPNSALTNNSLTVNGTAISLGGSGTVTANAATLTGTALNSTVTASSLTSVGTLTSLSVTGTITGNVSGSAATVTAASQPAITSVGTLTSLSVTGNVTAGGYTGTQYGVVNTTTGTFSGNVTAGGFSGAHYGSGAGLTSGTVPVAALASTTTTINGTAITLGGSGTVTANAATLTGTALNSTVTASSLTSVGNLTSLATSGNVSTTGYFIGNGSLLTGIPSAYGNVQVASYLPTYAGVISVSSATTAIVNGGTTGTGNIGATGATFNTVFAKATTATYADVAENYLGDAAYAPGTVVDFGGDLEVTASTTDMSTAVAGVVSTNPAYLMNQALVGDNVTAVAFVGRVPTMVTGTVRKGDLMVSAGNGRARAEAAPAIGSVIGKALADSDGDAVIEVVISRG